jgi:hypothetical protein
MTYSFSFEKLDAWKELRTDLEKTARLIGALRKSRINTKS